MQNRSAGNAFVRKDACKFPLWILLNHFRVVLHLQLITACLVVLFGTNTAIGTDAEFFLFRICDQILFCRYNLHLLLRTVGIRLTNRIFGRLPFLITTPTRSKWLFLGYFHTGSPPPAAEL